MSESLLERDLVVIRLVWRELICNGFLKQVQEIMVFRRDNSLEVFGLIQLLVIEGFIDFI